MKAKHYSKAKLLYGSTAYCDQWKKVMAIYDDSETLRSVIIGDEDYCGVVVLLIGDDYHKVYNIDDIEIGTTAKNMKACFDIYYALLVADIPEYRPYNWTKKTLEVTDIFTHTRVAAERHGGFRVVDDAEEKISKALEIAGPYFEHSDPIELGEYGDYWDGRYPGDMPCEMHYIGDGVWCDDDGDNWDFY